MQEFILIMGQPMILTALFITSITLVLLDYLLPVDWLAYLGYIVFAVFIGLTMPAQAATSILVAIGVGVLLLVAHKLLFSKYLTNAPRLESGSVRLSTVVPPDESAEC